MMFMRMTLGVGRMGSEQRLLRSREITLESINELLLDDYIEEMEGSNGTEYNIYPFSQDVKYKVKVENNYMMSCEFKNFTYNLYTYKHITVLKFITVSSMSQNP